MAHLEVAKTKYLNKGQRCVGWSQKNVVQTLRQNRLLAWKSAIPESQTIIVSFEGLVIIDISFENS